MTKIKLDIFFKNHLEKNINISKNIVDVEDGIFEISNKKIYNTFTFVTNKVYYSPLIVGDNKERIKIKYQIDDNSIVEEFFIIDSIEYLQNNNIKVYSKSVTFKYSKTKLNTIIKSNSIKRLIRELFLYKPFDFVDDIVIDYSKLTDIPLIFDYTIEDKSIDEVINDLSKITDFDYYFYQGVLYFEDKKTIKEDDEIISTFRDIQDIETFTTTTNNNEIKINKLYINEKSSENIISEPQIVLDLKDSPQCCSPDEVLYYTDDDGNQYKISPVNAFYIVYYTPLTTKPTINMNIQSGERIVVESYKLEKDNFVRLTGGIKEIVGIEGVENWSFEDGYNVLVFDYVEKGELKISYKTDVLYGSIEHSKYPKGINLTINHYNQIIDYEHQIELNGYYPIPYNFTLNLISDWGIDSSIAVLKDLVISKKAGDVFVKIGDFKSDAFGEVEFEINEYNTYKFETDGYDDLYLDWYVNNKELKMDETK